MWIDVEATISQITADLAQIRQQIDVTANHAPSDEFFNFFRCLFEQSMKSYLLWKSLSLKTTLCVKVFYSLRTFAISSSGSIQQSNENVSRCDRQTSRRFEGKTLCASEIWSRRDLISRFFGGAALMALAGVSNQVTNWNRHCLVALREQSFVFGTRTVWLERSWK